MNTVPNGSVKCPGCETKDARISATVSAGQWERHFYACPECAQVFMGDWYSTHEPQSHEHEPELVHVHVHVHANAIDPAA